MGNNVLETVVSNNVCVGCGMCAGLLPAVLCMHTDKYGTYLPELVGKDAEGWGELSLRVCPFANNDDNEDTIAASLYGDQEGVQHRSETGYYLRCFTGHVNDVDVRMASTSGGMISWLAGKMLSSGRVDAVVCVGECDDGEKLFKFQFITDTADLGRCRKSRYYPVEVSEVIGKIKESKGKVLFIGLPCFVKAMRLAMKADAVLESRIAYTIGLFCGHLKSKRYCEYLSRCCGVDENTIKTVDFRKKVPGLPANKYTFEVMTQDNGDESSSQIMMKDVWASSWSNNLFMLGACEYCDDVMAETADVSIGDAWLPAYTKDFRGTSIVVCRHRDILELLEEGSGDKDISLAEICVDEVIQSQAGAFRQRRTGMKYRLYLSAKKGNWKPNKRVTAGKKGVGILFRAVQRLRLKTRTLSHTAFLKQKSTGGLDIFVRMLKPWIFYMKVLNRVRHLGASLKRKASRLFNSSAT